jgi:vitamin B12 transport system substrate-binding protein
MKKLIQVLVPKPTKKLIPKFIYKLVLLLCLCFVSGAYASTAINQAKPRIIALSPHIVEMLYSIGAGDQIIATSEFSDYPDAAKKIPRIGNYLRIQIERIVELNPDYIIAWQGGSPSDDLARLKKLGFNIIYSDPKNFTDIASDLQTFGKISGHSKTANKLANAFLQRLEKIKTKYQNKALINAC